MLAIREMTQKELAERTGIRPPTISAICLGTVKHLPIEALDKICAVLDCQPADIMEYIPEAATQGEWFQAFLFAFGGCTLGVASAPMKQFFYSKRLRDRSVCAQMKNRASRIFLLLRIALSYFQSLSRSSIVRSKQAFILLYTKDSSSYSRKDFFFSSSLLVEFFFILS